MANPYVGEIRMFGGNFAPAGWAFCDGRLLPITENDTLFNLIGTTFGGDGQSSFGLPDLRGRVPVHMGAGPSLSNRIIGESGGSETVTLTMAQMAAHSHTMSASTAASSPTAGPNGGVLATSPTQFYGGGAPVVPMDQAAVTPSGGSQPHENMAPFQAVSFIISMFGIFPSQA